MSEAHETRTLELVRWGVSLDAAKLHTMAEFISFMDASRVSVPVYIDGQVGYRTRPGWWDRNPDDNAE